MRPRVFPAEDPEPEDGQAVRAPASMRPRVFPAEDAPIEARRMGDLPASMRPRVFPAEDGGGFRPHSPTLPRGFNEAAGIPRGRQHRHILCLPTGGGLQ